MLPDWAGETVAILASGPSASRDDAERLKGRARVIVVNCAWSLAPWADVLYAADPKWWRHPGDIYGRQAVETFAGLKLCSDAAFCESEPRVRPVHVRRVKELVFAPGEIGSGNNSGFQALNIAAKTGSKRVLLLGYDMHGKIGLHFHVDHRCPLGSPDVYTFARWRSAFEDAVPVLRDRGVEVINCTPGGALTMFPERRLDEVLC